MGMDKDSGQGLSKGIALLTDVLEFASLEEDERINHQREFAEKATMMELDAISSASQHRWEADEKVRQTHEELEESRAKAHTEWGQSGLNMSGSKSIVKEARRDQDLETEANQALLDDLKEQEILDKGLREANTYRIDKGRRPNTTLSLGSTIYKNRS